MLERAEAPTDRRFDIVALGEAMVEFNQTTPGQPQYLQGFGGDTSNAAIAATRAGARTAYLTRVGADPFGDALRGLWQVEGVDASAVESDAEAPTGLYFVTHGPHGHAFSYRRAGSAASRMTPAWLDRGAGDAVRTSRILHLSAISLAISPSACDTAFEAMRLAREAGATVSFDSNLRLALWPLARAQACIAHAAALCDLFQPGIDDLRALTGLHDPNAVADWCHAHGARAVVLKLGAEGVMVSVEGTGRERIAPRRVDVVDATGAGDCFGGNLLARIALGDDVHTAAHYANAAASLAVQGWGAVAPLPREADVRAVL